METNGEDFWLAWQEEQARFWQSHNGPTGNQRRPRFAGPELARAWRSFFRDFMGVWPEEHWALSGRRFKPWHQGVDTFNPFLASLLSKGGGLLPLYVLQLLAERPYYANELMTLIADRTGRQWMANPGAIYPLMNQMEQHHLIAGRWEDPRKRTKRIYQLTEAGTRELARLRSILGPRLQEAVEVLQELTQEINGQAEEDLGEVRPSSGLEKSG